MVMARWWEAADPPASLREVPLGSTEPGGGLGNWRFWPGGVNVQYPGREVGQEACWG